MIRNWPRGREIALFPCERVVIRVGKRLRRSLEIGRGYYDMYCHLLWPKNFRRKAARFAYVIVRPDYTCLVVN